jgi:methionyl-tRNA formyltransferase
VARLAVAATASFGADVLERLAAEHDIAVLLTRPDAPRGRGRKTAPSPAKEVADRLGIDVLQPARLDAGQIAARHAFPIGPDDDAGVVFARGAEIAVELLRDVLSAPRFEPQPDEGVTYAEKITAKDRELDWDRPAQELHNRVRALSPHIGARGIVDDRRVIVWRTRIRDGELELLEVQPEGRRRMTYEEFRRGLQ